MFNIVSGLLSLITPCVIGGVYAVWGIKELRHQSELHKRELKEIDDKKRREDAEYRDQQEAKNRPLCYTCAKLIIGCRNGYRLDGGRFKCKFNGKTELSFDCTPEYCGYYTPIRNNANESTDIKL